MHDDDDNLYVHIDHLTQHERLLREYVMPKKNLVPKQDYF